MASRKNPHQVDTSNGKSHRGGPVDPDVAAALIKRCKAQSMSLGWKFPFFLPSIARIEFRVDARRPTACVDLRGRIYVNPDFATKLKDSELQFVIAHELMHLLMLHHDRRGHRDNLRWNIACFPAGTLLPSGVPIDSIAHPLMINPFQGSLYKLRTQIGSVSATPEHPFLVRRRISKLGRYPIKLADPEWLHAEEIRIGDFICTPKLTENALTEQRKINLEPYINQGCDSKGRETFGNRVINRELTLNEDLAWLIGLYVAEGSFTTNNGGAQFSLGAHETALIGRSREIIEQLGYSAAVVPNGRGSTTVSSCSSIFGRWLSDICGRGAHNKHVPSIVLQHADPAIRAAFLDGYVKGDGYKVRQYGMGPNRHRHVAFGAGTVSQALAHDLPLLLAQDDLGAQVGIDINGPRWIGNQWCDTEETIYNVIYRPEGSGVSKRIMNGREIETRHARWKLDEHGIWYAVKEIAEDPYDGLVYNQETEDHTYIAAGYLVHNCDLIINRTLKNVSDSAGAGVFTMPKEGIIADEDQAEMTAEQLYSEIPEPPQWLKDAFNEGAVPVGQGCGVDKPDDGDGDEGENDGQTEDQLKRQWRECAAQSQLAGRQAGTQEGNMLADLLDIPPPKVRWSEVLRGALYRAIAEAGRDDVSWNRRSRRSTTDIILPGSITYRCKAAVVIDTSGSMSDEDLSRCVAETTAIVNNCRVPVFLVAHDHAVQEACWIRPGAKSQVHSNIKKRMKGRGGTSFVEAYQRVEDEPGKFNVLVHLTDGEIYGDWPDRPSSVRRLVVALVGSANKTDVPPDARMIEVEI